MSLTLNTNVSSLNTQNWLSVNSAGQAKATEQLSSGYKLNSSGDDPAGYAISFSLGVKDAVLQTAMSNANQGTAMLQVAQGAMQQIGNILTQLKQIATGAASGNDGSNLTSLDNERAALQTQIDNIDSGTTYSGTNVFGAGNTYTTTATTTNGLNSVDVSGASVTAATTFNITEAANKVTITNATTGASQSLSFVTPTGQNKASLDFSSFGINLTLNSDAGAATLNGTNIIVTPGAGQLTFQVGDTASAANQVSVTLGHVNSATLGLTGDLLDSGRRASVHGRCGYRDRQPEPGGERSRQRAEPAQLPDGQPADDGHEHAERRIGHQRHGLCEIDVGLREVPDSDSGGRGYAVAGQPDPAANPFPDKGRIIGITLLAPPPFEGGGALN